MESRLMSLDNLGGGSGLRKTEIVSQKQKSLFSRGS